jgi:hypothetical protein
MPDPKGWPDAANPGRATAQVIVTMASGREPYRWVIVDAVHGREILGSTERFRTVSLAWKAGVSAMANHYGL